MVFLGHLVDKQGVRPNPGKIAAVTKMQQPIDLTSLRRFLGLTSYYRRFIRNYSKVAEPLNRLLRKGKLFQWSNECQDAFEQLKKRLVEAPILIHPDFHKIFTLYTDASMVGIGAILTQLGEDGKEHVIAYASRTLNSAERNYSVTELECLAVVWGITHYRSYLFGRKFIVITDHYALKWLMTTQNHVGKLA